MTKLFRGSIVPGERVGIFHLGMPWVTLQQLLPKTYTIEQRSNRFVVRTPSIWFFINDSTRTLMQITVLNGFQGTVKQQISVGSTLGDLARVLGKWVHNGEAGYIIPNCPGVVFELDHPVFDDYIDQDPNIRIACISVY